MAATNRPRVLTERVLMTLAPEDLAKLDALAEARQLPRTETTRALIREAHARQERRTRRAHAPEEGDR